jgi:23S rRNA (cytidine1920-2'-O)/16S rRNA (cytidine1409-2'-O)-methyltransferase
MTDHDPVSGRKNKRAGKVRLDRLLSTRGLAETREKAQAIIIAGQVLVNGQKQDKAGTLVPEDADIRILGETLRYVSRGGLKLEAALQEFSVSAEGKTALDVGASTGGFTDCLLQHGCQKVYAVDVGYGQMAWKLRQDPRIVVVERTNIRGIDPNLVPVLIDLCVIDVSFISLEKVVPPIRKFLAPHAGIVALIKPQFEVGRDLVGKGGIVRDEAARTAAVEKVADFFRDSGFDVKGVIPSPITGQDGNVEYLIYAVLTRSKILFIFRLIPSGLLLYLFHMTTPAHNSRQQVTEEVEVDAMMTNVSTFRMCAQSSALALLLGAAIPLVTACNSNNSHTLPSDPPNTLARIAAALRSPFT